MRLSRRNLELEERVRGLKVLNEVLTIAGPVEPDPSQPAPPQPPERPQPPPPGAGSPEAGADLTAMGPEAAIEPQTTGPEPAGEPPFTGPEAAIEPQTTGPEPSVEPPFTSLEAAVEPQITDPEPSVEPPFTGPEAAVEPQITSPEPSGDQPTTSPGAQTTSPGLSPEAGRGPQLNGYPETTAGLGATRGWEPIDQATTAGHPLVGLGRYLALAAAAVTGLAAGASMLAAATDGSVLGTALGSLAGAVVVLLGVHIIGAGSTPPASDQDGGLDPIPFIVNFALLIALIATAAVPDQPLWLRIVIMVGLLFTTASALCRITASRLSPHPASRP